MFKVNNKKYFTPFSRVSFVNFKQVNVSWVFKKTNSILSGEINTEIQFLFLPER